jgi:predicted house-cleaning noncanonical NTP pyrophosphatase (MazG superfamily)
MQSLLYNKSVRDKIPDIIKAEGKTVTVKKLSGRLYRSALDKKLDEEVEEFKQSGSAEELADILEVVYALASTVGVSEDELNILRNEKRQAKGAFEKKLLLYIVS